MQKRGGVFSSKSGQVTIFIIIGILIVAGAVVFYFLIPKTQTGTTFDAKNPQGFMQNCLQPTFDSLVRNISLQGGSSNPDLYFMYNGSKVEYLCYTAESYTYCIVQRVLLQEHMESEVEKALASPVQSCFDSLVQNYQGEGYTVNLQKGKTNVLILPNKVIANMSGYMLNVSKGQSARYTGFNVILDNNLYELVNVANSIVDWESTEGDAAMNIYMTYYRDLKAEKMVQGDGTKIYVLTDRNSGLRFQFASRSVYLPPGYGLEGVAV